MTKLYLEPKTYKIMIEMTKIDGINGQKDRMLRKTVKIKGSAKKWKKDRRSAKKLPNLEIIYHWKALRETNPISLCVT